MQDLPDILPPESQDQPIYETDTDLEECRLLLVEIEEQFQDKNIQDSEAL
jgi:hypothetical protein